MTRPSLGTLAEEVYEDLYMFHERTLEDTVVTDGELGWPLLTYFGLLAKRWQPVEDLVRDTNAGPGWSALFDLYRIPDEALPWLGQVFGVEMLSGMTPFQMRERILGTDGFKRGTPDAVAVAARRRLTGNRTAIVTERWGGDPNRTAVVTFKGETPETDWDSRRDKVRKTPGLISLWSMDNNPGDLATPDSVGDRTATAANAGVAPQLGQKALVGGGRSALFGAAGNVRWDILGNAYTGQTFSIEAWFKVDNLVSGTNGGIFSLARNSQVHGAMLYVGSDARLNAQVWETEAWIGLGGSPGSLPLGEVIHAVLTYDGTTARLYQNGVLIDEEAGGYVPPDPTNTMFIGYYGSGTSLQGAIDEVALYDRALTEAEIIDHNDPTPTTSLVRSDIEEQMPWEVQLEYFVVDGWDFLTLSVQYLDFQHVRTDFADFQAVRDNTPTP